MAKSESNRKRGGTFQIVCCVILAVLVVLLGVNIWVRTQYFVVLVEGDSMANTLYSGEKLYAKRGTAAERGDIVIVDVSQSDHFGVDTIIKRLIAVGGDKIKCENHVVYLDTGEGYEALSEPYIKEGFGSVDFEEVALGEGEIFLLGDNRIVSNDSHNLSVQLKASDILGVVLDWSVSEEDSSYKSFGAVVIRGFLSGNFS